MGKVTEITDSAFPSEVLSANVPVVVDFWAPWCGPCRAIAPVVEELSEELQGKVKFVKINVDDNPAVASQLGIRSIPTLKLFVNGAEKNQMVGAGSKDQIKQLFSSFV
jgi:thioredoxin 1